MASIGAPSSPIVRQRPDARRNSPARIPADRSPCGSPRRPGSARCCSILSRTVALSRPRPADFPSTAARRPAEEAAACPAHFRASTCPAAPAMCASAYRSHRQDAALPQQPAPRIVGNRHAPELAAIDVRNSVVPREALIDERVIRIQQIEHVVIFVQDAAEEQLRLFLERMSADCRRNSGNSSRSGATARKFRR